MSRFERDLYYMLVGAVLALAAITIIRGLAS